MGDRDLITTIIPTYRRPRPLTRAIRSAQQQSLKTVRICVYDNASGDETPQVVARIAESDSRVRYYRQPHNLGPQANLQFALVRMDTPFFSLMGDDDALLPGFYETALAALNAHPAAMFAATRVLLVDQHGRVVKADSGKWPPGLHRPPDGLLAMLAHGHPTWTGILFRREALTALGGLDPETGMCSDLDFELRLAARYPFVICPVNGAIFGYHQDSTSSFPRVGNFWPGWAKMIRNLAEDEQIPSAVRERARRILNRQLAIVLFLAGLEAASNGITGDALVAGEVLRSRYRLAAADLFLRGVAFVGSRVPATQGALRRLIAIYRAGRRIRLRRVQREVDARYQGLLAA